MAVGGEHVAVFALADTIKATSKEAIDTLHKMDIRVAMMTGDNTATAEAIGKELGIDVVIAEVLPGDKADNIKKLQQEEKDRIIAMVGDGINDAPALARATVGISMGKIGSATAIDASDIVFLHDDLGLLDWLYTKARKTMRIVRENLLLALSVIFLVTTPALLGWIPLWLAVILHEGGTVLVGLNSLRLLKK